MVPTCIPLENRFNIYRFGSYIKRVNISLNYVIKSFTYKDTKKGVRKNFTDFVRNIIWFKFTCGQLLVQLYTQTLFNGN